MGTVRPSAKYATKGHVPANRNLKTHSQARISVQASNRKFPDLLAASEIVSEDPMLCSYL